MSERSRSILDVVKPTTWAAKLRDWSRGWPLLLIFVIALAITFLVSPGKVWLSVWGVAKMALGGFGGFWFHRWVAPYLRPHRFLDEATGLPPTDAHARVFALAVYTRCALVVAGVIAAGFIP